MVLTGCQNLTTDNVLVETSGVCKISGFGLSKRIDDSIAAALDIAMDGNVFMAPEMINAKDQVHGLSVDIWSVGCVVLEMLTGKRPWAGREVMAVLLHASAPLLVFPHVGADETGV